MLNVPPYRQASGLCGASSLKMVLAYFGVQKTERELAKLAGATPQKGTTGQGLIRAAKKLGFKGLIKDFANFKDLRCYVFKKKIPVIIDWFSEDEGHYSVVCHIDDKDIYLQDPELGALRTMDLKTFKRVWFDFPGNFLKSKNDLILRRIIVIWPAS
jgi:predicted double-glycine peptidase